MTKAHFQKLFEAEISQVFDTFTPEQIERYGQASNMATLSREGKIEYLASTSLELTPEDAIVETSTKTIAYLRANAGQREKRGSAISPGMKMLLELCDAMERAVTKYEPEVA